ncbi:MAG: YcgN family cysteine cluster protein [Spirochaetales bacterium]|nr:YcgN family cysteine cluster protein [Spirochaetales bacterium]
MGLKENFWRNKKLDQFTKEEWEALCDHCGKCCLHKIQDDKTEKIYTTYVACTYLEIASCRCTHYENRHELNPDCMELTPDNVKKFHWLPDSCTYRLIEEGKMLPWWHPLVSGNPLSTLLEGKSVAHIAVSERDVESIENHIIIDE